MSESKSLYILGYSGHAYVVIDVALSAGYIIKGYFDYTEAPNNPYDLNFFGNENEQDILKIVENAFVFPAMGSNSIRERVINYLEMNNLQQIALIDPNAMVSRKSIIGKSTLVAPKAVINSMATIGQGCIINSGAIIEHECEINDFSHVAPGAVLAGNVSVGKNTFIGANSVIKEGIKIGNKVVLGAGAVVLKDIPDGEVWVGNPSKRLRKD